MLKYRFPRLFCLIFLFLLSCAGYLFLLSGTAFSQTSDNMGVISIEVIDGRTKRQLKGATFVVLPREALTRDIQNEEFSTLKNKALPAGLYSVRVSHPGYLSLIEPSIRIVRGKTTSLSLAMTAAQPDSEESKIEEIVVYGDQARLDSLTSAGSRYIDREGLRSNAGSGSDILRALDGLPGLFSSGEFASYTVRGNGPRDNLILVDGFPFANIVHFDDSFGEQEDVEGGGRYSVFAPNLINGATFQPGGWSAAYGGKSGSLLQLDVAKGNIDSASYTARLDVAGLEVGYDGPSNFHKDTSILFSARAQDFGRFFETIGIEDVGSPENTDIILKTTTRLNDSNDLDMLLIYAPEKFERDIDNVLASDEDEPGNYEDIELEKSETENYLLGATWTRQTESNANWTHRLYYRYYEEVGSTGEAFPDLVPLDTPAEQVPVREDIITSLREETEIGFRTDFTTWNSYGEFNAGARFSQTDLTFNIALDDDWQRFEYDSDDFRASPEQRFVVLTPESLNSALDETSRLYTLYADQTFEFDSWDVRSGVRIDRDSLSDETIFSPRISLNWRANEKTKLVVTAGRYNQAPRFNDRATDPSNTKLEHEITDQISVGLSYMLRPDIELLIEPYYQDLSNLIVETDGVDQTLSNTGEGRSFGVDSAVIKRFGNGWSASMNYSYNKAEIKDAPDLAFYDADFHRPNSFSIGGAWEINDRWKVSARWKYASGTPRDASIIHENVLGEGQPLRFSKENITTNTERFDNFHALNFRVDYRRTFGSMSMIAFFDVINAYGADNPSTSEFNERTGQDVIEEGETLPILGLRLEW